MYIGLFYIFLNSHRRMWDFRFSQQASVRMAVFWVVAPCNLVEVYRHFRGACCLHQQGDEIHRLKSHLVKPCGEATLRCIQRLEALRIKKILIALRMEAASTSETSVNFYYTTRRNNPEDSQLSSNVSKFKCSLFPTYSFSSIDNV
jgi:hypothetical protein